MTYQPINRSIHGKLPIPCKSNSPTVRSVDLNSSAFLKTHRRAVGKRRADGGDEEIAVTSYCVMVASFADVAHRTARVRVYILAIPGDY